MAYTMELHSVSAPELRLQSQGPPSRKTSSLEFLEMNLEFYNLRYEHHGRMTEWKSND